MVRGIPGVGFFYVCLNGIGIVWILGGGGVLFPMNSNDLLSLISVGSLSSEAWRRRW